MSTTWGETFADRYEEWSIGMTDDVLGDNRVDLVCDNGAVSSLWWATKNEWLGLIDVAGLELETLYGGFAREPFTPDTSEYVFVASRGRRA
jgi:hypothetical protein